MKQLMPAVVIISFYGWSIYVLEVIMNPERNIKDPGIN